MRRLKINIYKENLLIIFTSLPIDKACCLGFIERKPETDSSQYKYLTKESSHCKKKLRFLIPISFQSNIYTFQSMNAVRSNIKIGNIKVYTIRLERYRD